MIDNRIGNTVPCEKLFFNLMDAIGSQQESAEGSTTPNTIVKKSYQELIAAGGIIFLLLPNLLFIAGWIRPVAAIPLIVLMLWASCSVIKDLQCRHVLVTKRDKRALILTMLGVLLVVEMISFHGHIPQAGDFFVRNPIYNTLILCDWPLFSAQNEYFVYYAAYWLPPALAAKLIPSVNPAHFLFLWTWLGLIFAFGSLFLRLRSRVWGFFLIFFIIGSIHSVHDIFPGLAWRASFDERWALFKYATDTFYAGVLFPGGLVQCGSTFNHAVPMLIAGSLIWSRLVPVRHMPFVASLSVTCSPIGAVGLFLLLMMAMSPWLCKSKNLLSLCKCFSLWCGVILLFFVGWYFSSASSNMSYALPLRGGKGNLLRPYIVYLCSFVTFWLPFFLLLRCGKTKRLCRTKLFYAAVLLSLVISLIKVGIANNELMFKASLFIFIFLALLFSRWWQYAGKTGKCLFVCCLAVYSLSFMYRSYEMITAWSLDKVEIEKHIVNPWKGHLNHPEHWANQQFWVKSPQEFSPLYNEEGASAKTLLAPVATGLKCSGMGGEEREN